MKNFISFLFAMAMCIGLATGAYAQTDSTASEKSSTVSSLCTAQEDVIKEVLAELYTSDGKIDVVKSYESKIKPRIAECLEIDMYETGIKIQQNALEGKFKKIRLKFEKPEDNTFKISGKAKRTYLRSYKKFKKEFPDTRKGKTLEIIFSDKEMAKRVEKVSKAMTREFKKDIRRVSK